MIDEVRRKKAQHIHGVYAAVVTAATVNQKTDEVVATISVPELDVEIERSWPIEWDENSRDSFELEAFLGSPLPDKFKASDLNSKKALAVLSPKKIAGGKLSTAILTIVSNQSVIAAAKSVQPAEGTTK